MKLFLRTRMSFPGLVVVCVLGSAAFCQAKGLTCPNAMSELSGANMSENDLRAVWDSSHDGTPYPGYARALIWFKGETLAGSAVPESVQPQVTAGGSNWIAGSDSNWPGGEIVAQGVSENGVAYRNILNGPILMREERKPNATKWEDVSNIRPDGTRRDDGVRVSGSVYPLPRPAVTSDFHYDNGFATYRQVKKNSDGTVSARTAQGVGRWSDWTPVSGPISYPRN